MIQIFKRLRARPKENRSKASGFTLLEVLMVIGILAILSTLVLVAINPARQFKIARDSQRTSNVAAILSAIGQNLTDHSGQFVCDGVVTQLPTDKTNMASGDGFDIGPCLVPDYISALPYDPSKTNGHWVDETMYDTGYWIQTDAYGRVTISADGEVSSTTISVTR